MNDDLSINTNAVDNKKTDYLWSILVFLILGFPRIMQIPKIALCLLIIIGSINSIKIYSSFIRFLYLWTIYVILTVFVGFSYGNYDSGIMGFIRVNVVDVMIYIVLLSTAYEISTIRRIIRSLLLALLYISIFNILLITFEYLRFDITFFKLIDATAGIGLHNGYVHLVSTNLTMSIMLFPFFLLLKKHLIVKDLFNEKIYTITLVLCAVSMLLSGRRILWIVLALSLSFFIFKTSGKIRTIILLLTTFILAFLILDYLELASIDGIIERFQFAFSEKDEFGKENVRNVQSESLLNGFCDKIICGNGAGAVLSDYRSSSIAPWTFEMSYHLVLFQSGIVGTFFYLMALCTIGSSILQAKKKDNVLGFALLITYLLVLFANATNPYFSSSFDMMFFLFFPLLMSEAINNGYIGTQKNIEGL